VLSLETRSVIWKEWRERRTALAVCTAWMVACALYAAMYEAAYRVRAPIATYYVSASLFMLFASVFLAMQTAVGERTRGTLGFSRALPMSKTRLAGWRLASGGLTLVAPMVVGALLLTPLMAMGGLEQAALRNSALYVQLPLRPAMSGMEAVELLWMTIAVAAASGLQFYLLLSVFGTRCRTESPVGFVGVLLAFVWLTAPQLRMSIPRLGGWFGALLPSSFIINYGYSGKEGSYTDLDVGAPLWLPLAVNAVLLLLLAGWFVTWYGAPIRERGDRGRWPWRWPALWSRIGLPLPNELSALVWLNLRQSLPLALAGLILATLITATEYASSDQVESFRSQLPRIICIVGMLWSTVVGVGVFAGDLRPQLFGFWRSRPIGVGWWFWCKFLVGLAAVLLVLDGTTIWYSWGTPIDLLNGMSWSYVACVPILHATLYAVAVFGVCRFRRPFVGGALAVAGYLIMATMLQSFGGDAFEPIEVYDDLLSGEMDGQFAFRNGHYFLVYGIMAVLGATCAVLALRAVRRPVRAR
jgi:hypothetical protein